MLTATLALSFYLLTYSLYLVLSLMLLMALKELLAYLTLKFSAQPGVVNIYRPLRGFMYFFGVHTPEIPRWNQLTDTILKYSDAKAIQCNHPLNPLATTWILHNLTTYKEFFAKIENIFTTRIPLNAPKEWKAPQGLHGPIALNQRGIMNEFFLWENMRPLGLRIKEIINRTLDRMTSEKSLDSRSWTEVDWKKYSEVIFDDIVN